MYKLPILSLLLFLCFILKAQNNESFITDYPPTKSELISKGRSLLLDEFLADNMEQVESLFLYLINLEDDDYRAFYYDEKIILSCWTGHYEIALNEILYIDSVSPFIFSTGKPNPYYYGKISPPWEDILKIKVFQKTELHNELLYEQIKKSHLTDEEKEVLFLVVMDFINWGNFQNRQLINQLSQDFLSAYPESKYAHFIRNNVQYIIKYSDWNFGIGGSLGYLGTIGKLNDYFSGAFTLGIFVDIYYKDFVLMMNGYMNGAQKTKQDIILMNKALWENKSTIYSCQGYLAFGYRAVKSNHISIIPFMGYGGYYFSPEVDDKRKNRDLEKQKITSSLYAVGIKIDYTPIGVWDDVHLGIKFSYYTPVNRKYDIQGDIFSITFDITNYLIPRKRIY